MISYLSNSIALFLFSNKIIQKEKVEVCEYGFEVLISTLVGFTGVVISGVVFNEIISSLIFYGLFAIVRLFSGGYHANSHIKCKTILISLCSVVLIITKYALDLISFELHLCLLIGYIIIICVFAPIEHINAPLTNRQKKKNKLISVVLSILLTIINIICFFYLKKYAAVSSLTLFIIALLIIIPKLIERRDINAESNKNSA